MPRRNRPQLACSSKFVLGLSVVNIFICALVLWKMDLARSHVAPVFHAPHAAGWSNWRPHDQNCSPCSGRIRGPIPTTLPEDVLHQCEWKMLPHSSLADAQFSSSNHFLKDAKELCVNHGEECQGVVCNATDDGKCRLVRGRQLIHADTAIHVKECLCSGSCQQHARNEDLAGFRATIVVLGHNRYTDLAECLTSLLRLPDIGMFHLHVSIDDAAHYDKMAEVVTSLSKQSGTNMTMSLVEGRKINNVTDNQEQQKWFKTNTGKIAHHYWAAFERTFMEEGATLAVFVEEDLVVAPDFLALFLSTWHLFQQDESLWCVSAWNDVGFTLAAVDQCRLFRTSYFPGLGFMLPKQVWLSLRRQWPSAPTMGWDYWMRAAFRRSHKECIVPEVPRSHHFSQKGSSITQDRQVEFFQSMALASVPSSCSTSARCTHFGDVSYLVRAKYETWILHASKIARPFKGASVVKQTDHECRKETFNLGIHDDPDTCAGLVALSHCAKYFMFAPHYPEWGCRCCEDVQPLGKPHAAWSVYEAHTTARMDPQQIYILPYIREHYVHIAPMFGLMPLKMEKVIPPDVRAEHEGLLVGRHVASQAVVLLADTRSPKPYLPASMRVQRHADLVPVKAARGSSCDVTCAQIGLQCDAEQLHFLNNCVDMDKAFGCKYCAHQVGKELPAYVVDEFQPTVGQCLVTFISPMTCQARHSATQRLCACMPIQKVTGSCPPKPKSHAMPLKQRWRFMFCRSRASSFAAVLARHPKKVVSRDLDFLLRSWVTLRASQQLLMRLHHPSQQLVSSTTSRSEGCQVYTPSSH